MSKILIFDSGVGGISIYKAIKEQLPNADYLYLFDNAYFPYGELDPEFLIERVCQLIGYMYENHSPDLVVIACNSASTLVLPALRQRFPIAFVGVVPAIKPAALHSKKKKIGLLATPGTVSREYTQLLVNEHAQDCEIDMIGTTSLVLQAENKLYGHAVDLDEISNVVSRWQDPDHSPDIVVLGCTHFPLLVSELENLLGEHIQFIDSGMAIASRVKDILGDGSVIASQSNAGKAFCTKIQAQKKLTLLFNEIGLSQPLYIDV
ncbi:glutamate racemase [Moritella sp. Urea-trap-13]|uniref:glutamate racemase n=1 Tax=Moritella sp. Urea-trap-13 TaxID=2058327 RepID=UPI000C33AE4C|nr:glutamate racemase [Moritella sp. Urea-trap-13]PKH09119.1 glutamate racemase [Moritella sp. Urea-trap-13]